MLDQLHLFIKCSYMHVVTPFHNFLLITMTWISKDVIKRDHGRMQQMPFAQYKV